MDHAERVLAAVEGNAVMGIESGSNFSFGAGLILRGRSELGTAPLTHSQVCRVGGNDAEFSFHHTPSLPL